MKSIWRCHFCSKAKRQQMECGICSRQTVTAKRNRERLTNKQLENVTCRKAPLLGVSNFHPLTRNAEIGKVHGKTDRVIDGDYWRRSFEVKPLKYVQVD